MAGISARSHTYYMHPNFTNQAPNERSLEDDNMDSESDGGVSLDSFHIITSNDSMPLDTPDVRRIYHQGSVTELDGSTSIWRLPIPPKEYNHRCLKYSSDHPIIKAYIKHCGLISRHWNCRAEESVPSKMRGQTPYSFALLTALRRLASLTKQNPQFARCLLVESWQKRVSQLQGLQSHELPVTQTIVDGGAGIQQHCEDKIYERPSGLMLCDVSQAVKQVRFLMKAQRQAKKVMGKTPRHIARQQAKLAREVPQGENPQSSIVDRVTARRRDQRSTKLETFGVRSADELVNVEVKLTTDDRSWVQDVVTAPANPPTKMFPKSSERERHQEIQANRMSRVLNNIDINSQKRPGLKRAKRLHAGGFSRRGPEKIAMPSEKSGFASVPSLHTIASATDEMHLARLGQLRLSDYASSAVPP